MGRTTVLGLVAVAVLAASPVVAGNNPNGIVFRAVGWFKGESEITAGQIRCEIPTVDGAISEGSFSMGLWNTFGVPTLMFPDINHPFANPCGGWIQFQSNLALQGLTIDRVHLRYSIRGAGRFRQFVPTRRRWPIACREFRKEVLYTGNRLNPADSTNSSSGSGAPNVALVQMLPLVNPQLIHCLRSQYAGLSTDLFVSLPLIIRARAVAFSDANERYVSNAIKYSLSLRHTCGNGRVDDGELCDPSAPFNSCVGVCKDGTCSQSENIGCSTNADCVGSCMSQDSPSECVCVY